MTNWDFPIKPQEASSEVADHAVEAGPQGVDGVALPAGEVVAALRCSAFMWAMTSAGRFWPLGPVGVGALLPCPLTDIIQFFADPVVIKQQPGA